MKQKRRAGYIPCYDEIVKGQCELQGFSSCFGTQNAGGQIIITAALSL